MIDKMTVSLETHISGLKHIDEEYPEGEIPRAEFTRGMLSNSIAVAEELMHFQSDPASIKVCPWKDDRLKGWSIVGMNHYRSMGEKMIFVAMIHDRTKRAIVAEGADTMGVWFKLFKLADDATP